MTQYVVNKSNATHREQPAASQLHHSWITAGSAVRLQVLRASSSAAEFVFAQIVSFAVHITVKVHSYSQQSSVNVKYLHVSPK